MEAWPALPFAEWADTCATLHLWTQVVGKIRLTHAPLINHWWQVPLYVTSRGLTTSIIPFAARGFSIDFDFIDHALVIRTSDGGTETTALVPRSVADFHAELMGRLRALGFETRIWTMPVEIPDAIPFEQDHTHAAYDADAAWRFWQVLMQADRVCKAFRSRFLGKVSPVHFFWGSFDLAVTRFSGRTAPALISDSPNGCRQQQTVAPERQRNQVARDRHSCRTPLARIRHCRARSPHCSLHANTPPA
jgi:Family of unknown function (DUF5996)